MNGRGSETASGRSSSIIAVRVVLVVVAFAVLVLYLAPRVIGLVALPKGLDDSVESAQRYNPAMEVIVDHEQKTVRAFDVLERMQDSLTQVQRYDAQIGAELRTLIDRIRGDVSSTLADSNGTLSVLLNDLDALVQRVDDLRGPAGDVDAAVTLNRATLDSLLASVRRTAERVEQSSDSAKSVAGHLSGDSDE